MRLVVLWPGNSISEEELVNSAAGRGVGVYGISPYFLKRPSRTGILLGYSRMKETEIREGIRRLGEVVSTLIENRLISPATKT
ncbi:MAG TPA: hypothetical protein VF011_09730 [Terriglobales bacterium]